VGLFEWIVTFRLKNASATYQRAMNLIFHDLLGVIMEVYIDDIVIKSAGFSEHMADLQVALERMRKYVLKMNPLKCAIGVSAGRFLGFVVHEGGIQIDPKKIESIRKFGKSTCKKGVQKLLGKIIYLRRFIANLAGKIESFLSLIWLKHEGDFSWGAEQDEALERIRRYLTSPPILQAPKPGQGFRLYIATQERAIGAELAQMEGKAEFMVAYVSQRLLDAEVRYVLIEKLCLALYYTCSKFRPYILSSACTVICQHNVVKSMLHKPILSRRLGKWVYSLIEYDLSYEPLRTTKGQVVADFIVDHMIEIDDNSCIVEILPWKLYFDGRCVVGVRASDVASCPQEVLTLT
jgi:hypothetical protein